MRKIMMLLWAAAVLVLLSGCVSYYRGERYGGIPEYGRPQDVPEDGVSAPVFYGYGTGASREDAQSQAVRNAIERAAVIALGDQAAVYQERVRVLFSRSLRVDTYTIPSSRELIDWDYTDGSYEAIVSVRLLLPEISRLLQNNDITGGLVQDHIALRLPDQELPEYASSTPLSEVLPLVGLSWADGIKPTFLVYYDEDQVSDPFTARAAVLMANDYLSSIGFEYVDLSQIESIKSDQEYAYVAEHGETSMLRWIASRLHADYYVDAAVSTSTFSRNGSYYAEATVLLSCFDASTAAGRGTAFVQSEDPVQGSTRNSAIDKAVAQGISRAMAQIMEKTSVYFVRDAQRGESYDLIIMKTYQDRVVKQLEQILSDQVESLQRISYSPEETRYDVRYGEGADDLIDLVYDAAERIPELQGFYLLYQRGNSITFTTGW